MEYETLKKTYYKDPTPEKALWQAEYERRFASPSARHIPIEIRQLGRRKGYPAFFCYTEQAMLLLQSIYEKQAQLTLAKNECPAVLLSQLALGSLVDEIQSTNDIEGVCSTRREIRDIIEEKRLSGHAVHLMSVVRQYQQLLARKDISFHTCADIRHFYDAFVLDEVASENPKNHPDGQWFRADCVSIESGTGKEKHRGLMPESAIIEAMEQALALLHTETIPLWVRLAIFHFYLSISTHFMTEMAGPAALSFPISSENIWICSSVCASPLSSTGTRISITGYLMQWRPSGTAAN